MKILTSFSRNDPDEDIGNRWKLFHKSFIQDPSHSDRTTSKTEDLAEGERLCVECMLRARRRGAQEGKIRRRTWTGKDDDDEDAGLWRWKRLKQKKRRRREASASVRKTHRRSWWEDLAAIAIAIAIAIASELNVEAEATLAHCSSLAFCVSAFWASVPLLFAFVCF
jgi:hypothetical protein